MNPPNLESLEQSKRVLIELCIRYGPRVLSAILIIIVGSFLALRLRNAANSWLGKRGLEPPVRMLLVRLLSLICLILFILMALQNLGVDFLPLIASLGVAGVGLGLAMQGVLSNLVAGLTIIFTRPFRVGEYVSMVGVEGQVESVELFSTTLTHPDQSRVVIPNRKLVGEILHNYGRIRQLSLTISVAYNTDIPFALKTIHEALSRYSGTLTEPAPVVGVSALSDFAITIAVKPWVSVEKYVNAQAELNQALLETFRARQIEIPMPQYEIRMLPAK